MDIRFDVDGVAYTVKQRQAEILAENLRGFAHGNFPQDVRRVGPEDAWRESARQAADWIETWLVEEPERPIPLESGKAAQGFVRPCA